jgi:prevent-host-death family protein
MKLSHRIKPISYLKAHAADVARNLGKQGEPLVITQNGEAKLVVQDVESFEQAQETMALLKILALGNLQVEEGRIRPAAEVIESIRKNPE